jgi:Flp pilus assembly protein TadD
VPVAELVSSGVRSPSAARQALGATITVSISVHRVADSLLVSVSLADAEKVRQLAGESRTFPRSTFSPELVVNLVVPLLELQLAANQRTAWSQAASTVPEAGVLYAQALSQTPYQQAQSRLEEYDQARSLEQAIKLLNDAINLEPRYAAAHAALGEARIRLYRLTKDPSALDLAEQSARQALSFDNTRPAAWMTLGMARAQRGDLVEAEKSFTEAIARNPNGADIYRELGLAYQRVKLWDKAEAAYRRAVSLQPKSWSSHSYLGSFFFRRERYPEGEAEFRRALEFAPENARVWSNLGGLYLAQERWKDAEAALITAVRIHPYGPALSNLGYLYTYVNRNDQAAATAFEQGTVVSPRDPRIWRNLGTARRRVPGQREQAIDAYRRAAGLFEEERKIDPTDAEVLVGLADCYAQVGEGPRARSIVSEALTRGIVAGDWPGVVGVFEDLGDRQGALRQAAAAFKAGASPDEFAKDPTFDSLRKDPRYLALVKAEEAKGRKGR